MIDKEEIHNTSLAVFNHQNGNEALRHFVLFTSIDNTPVIALNKDSLQPSFDYIAKNNLTQKIIFLDTQSYDALYKKAIEKRADDSMSSIATDQSNVEVEDDGNYSVAEFLKTSSDIMTSEESAPIIKFVNSLFYQAIKQNASDIHVEMHEFKGEIRYRIDGVLIKHIELDKHIMSLVISRIKVISDLDISEKRIPQDGRTQIKIAGNVLDIRVSVLPTFYGERVVMRILMQSDAIPKLDSLGIPPDITKALSILGKKSHGMILVTGPTGSGKSTTLHSLLHSIATPEKNIITVEDPVEYKSDLISQIQTNAKVGLTFASGLRSILRQDPDVVMVGEIRDQETASIAVQSALTGHLVLSTLHTNRAPAAITRLRDMGIEDFLIGSSVLGVLAQRLVRKLCDNCKEEDSVDATQKKSLGISSDHKLFKAKGCKECGYSGYKGRVAVAELFLMHSNVKALLRTQKVDDNILMAVAMKNKMVPITLQITKMLVDGQTSIQEATRVGLDK